MGLIRILLLGLIVYVAWRLVKRTLNPGTRMSSAQQDRPEKMLRCEKCGVHVPQELVSWHQDHSFCCKEHSDAWHKDNHN